jgi:hypothetical protein
MAERAAILAMIDQRLPRNEISRRTGRSNDSVSRIAREEGRTFDRAHEVSTALAARKADLAIRRAAIIDRNYARVEHLQARLTQPMFWTILRDAAGRETPSGLDFVPALDERNIADTISRYLTTTIRLEEVDNSNEADGVKSMLAALGHALKILPE